MSTYSILAVGIGGFIGSVLRYISVLWVDRRLNSLFPYGTLLVNAAGSLVLGVVVGYAIKNSSMNGNTTLFLTTGFCGGFTTFSAFSLENINLLRSGFIAQALVYSAVSLTLGFLAVYIGVLAGKAIS